MLCCSVFAGSSTEAIPTPQLQAPWYVAALLNLKTQLWACDVAHATAAGICSIAAIMVAVTPHHYMHVAPPSNRCM
jgi:hypothetical protein